MTDFVAILPEIIVALSAFSLLLISAWRGDRAASISVWVSVLALIGAAFGVAMGDNRGQVLAFDGFVIMDDFRRMIKVMILLAVAGSLCLAPSLWDKKGEGGGWPEYSVLVLLATLGMMVLVCANDWLALYAGIELQNIALYILVAIKRTEKTTGEAGLKLFMLGAFSSAIMLFGLSFLVGLGLGTGFGYTAAALTPLYHDPTLVGARLGIVFILAGFAFKISAAPFHMWVPDVYEGAPTSIAAFLSLAPKIAAFAALVAVLFGPLAPLMHIWRPLVIFLSAFSMVWGSLAGLRQTNLRRLMAYSGIANIGAILAGIACADTAGIQGGLLYLAIYFVANLGVFAVILSLKTDEGRPVETIQDMEGLSHNRPFLALGMTGVLFSLIGIPPLAGFFGKALVFLAVIKAGLWPLAVLGVLASVIAAFYYLRIVKVMYFSMPHGSGSAPMAASVFVVAVVLFLVVSFVLLPSPLIDSAKRGAESLLI